METDRKALVYLHQSTKYIVLDWLDFLLEYDFYVVYQKGITNILSDRLLRLYEGDSTMERWGTDKKIIVLNVRDLEIESVPAERIKKLIDEFIHSVARKKDPLVEEREELIWKKHQESHIRTRGLYLVLFCNGYY